MLLNLANFQTLLIRLNIYYSYSTLEEDRAYLINYKFIKE